jgi:glycosyltransferase involved in cell wall biosynthesis
MVSLMNRPTAISVVIATYNRSNVLHYAIESVLAQTVSDWEMVVIGDACTDDTAEVVESFGDRRIRFHNLDQNVGEQSGPNNVGTSMARGQYVAYLNQDDIWMPHHLETLLEGIQGSDADLVHGVGVAVNPTRHYLVGVMPDTTYRAHVEVPASLWMFRRGLFDEIGGWRGYRTTWSIPSQDFLARVAASSKSIIPLRAWTCLIFPSASQSGSYAQRLDEPQATYWKRLNDQPRFSQELAETVSTEFAAKANSLGLWPLLRRIAGVAALRAGYHTKIGPQGLAHLILFGRRGKAIDKFRRVRGLPPIDRKDA